MIAIPLTGYVEFPASLSLVSFLSISMHTQQASIFNILYDLFVCCDYAAAFAGGDVLNTVEAEADNIAEGANQFILVFTPESMGRIFDNTQAIFFCKLVDVF